MDTGILALALNQLPVALPGSRRRRVRGDLFLAPCLAGGVATPAEADLA